MATESPIRRVREGMRMVSSDGVDLGRVGQVYHGTEPADALEACEDETSIEVRRESLGRETAMYVPCRAVADVIGSTVRLKLDLEAVTSGGWVRRPEWIGEQ